MKLKYYMQTGVVALIAATTGVSCTDTWDDHYSVNGSVPGATLWENMLLDESIRPFVRVLDSCGYKDMLNSNQVFTVWAPEITEEEAQEWIETYKREKSLGIIDDDNATLIVDGGRDCQDVEWQTSELDQFHAQWRSEYGGQWCALFQWYAL